MRFESHILTLAPTGKSVKFPNSGGRKRHNPVSPAFRTLFVVEILDVSYLKSTVYLEPAGSKNTFMVGSFISEKYSHNAWLQDKIITVRVMKCVWWSK